MTLHHPTRRTAPATPAGPPGQRTRDWITALGALLLLVAFVIGIPLVLLVVAPLGGLPTSWTGLTTALTRPDDGHLFLAALALVAWIAWAVFTLSVALETVSVLRGIPTPTIPLLHAPQRAAASLVAGAALLLSAPTPTAVAPKPVVASASATPAPAGSTAPSVQTTALAQPTASTAAPGSPARIEGTAGTTHTTAHAHSQHTVTVHRGDTLWSIAETKLGAGSRFREIAQLNYGRPQPDGRTLTDTHWIYPGWVLLLPTTTHTHSRPAASPTASREATGAHDNHREYVVRRGDTLWDIAEDQLGDHLRYKEIFHLNQGRPQHDGKTLTDPSEILIGWRLRLPPADHQRYPTRARASHPASTATPAPTNPTSAAPAPSAPTPTVAQAPTDHATSSPLATADPEHHHHVQPDDSTTLTLPSAPSLPTPSITATPLVAVASTEPASDGAGVDFSRLAIGLTVLAATGALAEVARRRRRHQSSRRPGQRLTMPEGPVAAAEAQLRASNTPLTLDTLRTSLAQIVTTCRAAATPLPRIHAVLVSAASIDLLVPDDEEPCAPFAPVGAGRWRLDPAQLNDNPPEALVGGYPALVSVGTVDDAVLLLNLEAVGTLSISGDQAAVDEVRRTLAVELATSPLSGGVALTLPENLSDLADVADPDRVCATSTEAGARRAHARAAAVRRLLDSLGAVDVNQARASATDNDAWQPEVLLTDTDVSAAPWSGVAVIRGTDAGEPGAGMHLAGDGTATLIPFGICFHPSRLSDRDYKQLLTILGSPDPVSHHDDVDVADLTADDVQPAARAATTARSERNDVRAALATPVCQTSIDVRDRRTPGPVADVESRPGVRLLGRPDIVGARGGDDTRRARQIELVAYLALHPGATAPEIDEALFPGRRVSHDMRNSLVARTRTWLGTDNQGTLHLPLVVGANGYTLADSFGSDWDDFLALARRGIDSESVTDLQDALRLVRGRPFLGVDPAAYVWAEAVTQEMISSIVDVAHVLAARLLEDGDPAGAQDAAARGLLADPANESLHRAAITAALARGDRDEAARLEARLRIQLEDIDPDANVTLLTT